MKTYLQNWKDVFWAFVDLEKAYDTLERHGMWQMHKSVWSWLMIRLNAMVWGRCIRVCGVGGKLLKAMDSFYLDNRVCVRVIMNVSKWFPVDVGMRLFGVIKEHLLIHEQLWENIGEKNFALIQYRWNFARVWVNAIVVVP